MQNWRRAKQITSTNLFGNSMASQKCPWRRIFVWHVNKISVTEIFSGVANNLRGGWFLLSGVEKISVTEILIIRPGQKISVWDHQKISVTENFLPCRIKSPRHGDCFAMPGNKNLRYGDFFRIQRALFARPVFNLFIEFLQNSWKLVECAL